SLASTGPLEHVASVGESVLLHPHEVRVAWPHLSGGLLRAGGGRRHLLVPFVASDPLTVLDLDRHRGAEGAAMAHTAEQGQFVLFDPLARTTGEDDAAE